MKKIFIPIVSLALLFTSCNEEYLDPTKPSQNMVLSTRDGIIGASNGLQQLWTIDRISPVYNTVTGNGFTTLELRLLNAGNVDEGELSIGGEVLSTKNTVVNNLWSQCLIINSESQKILDNVNVLTSETERASVLVHASIFKALALSTLVQYFQNVPLRTEKNAAFNTRTEVLNAAIAYLKATEPSLDKATGFAGLVNTINYKNTVYALLARMYMMTGDNDNALKYAGLVDLNVKSVFGFDVISNNPIAFISITTNNVFQPVNLTLGLPASLTPNASDERLNFYIKPGSNPTVATGFFDTNTKAIPVYLPGEMMLLKAEAYARKDNVPQAIIELNKVLTKTTATDAYGIGANLPPYAGAVTKDAVLEQIYRNRCIEMYMSSLKLEDSRRFNRTGAGLTGAERNRNWYPYPDSERNNNTNTPADPAI
ncbi:RagB/SusD family nutrient uptake outer membrane protein [Flavobacterium sp. Fl-318]|uniref:RagB/SusD family nutrient uptake outer membrane protein n=1 Tax=Flavobacterium cupriresistens TaxID=2893885 RepID=A0ABU4R9B4_9FLAO|nr:MULTISPECIES: RagB/SusD family nutrient uptake outer membrane protein [unclassified Flavobacterium]MDX6188613.1 RagB/SusD family nutrient uptake outer membrane protein [Flavobacterium sp. Fl-318]UFH44720.1 RagB/SusD family nutrient uptake outer membrane protein [Flavobacterium sp. F-323]